MIDGVEAQPDKASGLHYLTAENGNGFHAIAKDHEHDELSVSMLV
jgi:hypothetical protein